VKKAEGISYYGETATPFPTPAPTQKRVRSDVLGD